MFLYQNSWWWNCIPHSENLHAPPHRCLNCLARRTLLAVINGSDSHLPDKIMSFSISSKLISSIHQLSTGLEVLFTWYVSRSTIIFCFAVSFLLDCLFHVSSSMYTAQNLCSRQCSVVSQYGDYWTVENLNELLKKYIFTQINVCSVCKFHTSSTSHVQCHENGSISHMWLGASL